MANMIAEQAKKILREIPEQEKGFWLHNGPVLKSLADLSKAMESMSNETFKHHVNPTNNDFVNWVNDVVGDKVLANAIKQAKTQKTALRKLKERIELLKKIAK